MDNCNCKNLRLNIIESPVGPTRKNRSVDATCSLRKDPHTTGIKVEINKKYQQLTGKDIGGIPTCVFYSDPQVACSECSYFEVNT